jgi:CubicO group peptidase (beta-lactamase class C family)
MGRPEVIRGWLPDRLAALAPDHQVPGAVVAVLSGGEIIEAAYGVLSRTTGVPVTTDSLFQVGSITKIWTTSLIMQLVDEGRLDLDAPVRRYLPGFRVADEPASARITVRHLTCHTAGFEGDIFLDTGRGDDAVGRLVDRLAEVPQVFPPGERHSYNNAGFVVLGRVVEVLRDKPYAAALRDHLAGPLGLDHLATDAHEAILHRAAVGHVTREQGAAPAPAPVWGLAASNAPAGSLLSMSAADLLRFARLHLDQGKTPDGTRLLSATSVAEMQRRQVDLPYPTTVGDAWGTGWALGEWDGAAVVGHNGGTVGQAAVLRVVPAAGVAVAVLTNGGELLPLYRALVGEVLRELAGIRMPPPPEPPAEPRPVDPHPYTGGYQNRVVRYDVGADGPGRLWLSTTRRGAFAELGAPVERFDIVRLAGDTFISVEPQYGEHVTLAFADPDPAGRCRLLYLSRAVPRTGDA